MPRPKKKSVVETLKGIEEKLGIEEGRGTDGGSDTTNYTSYFPDADIGQLTLDPEQEASIAVDRALSTLPPTWQDCYAKIYKIRPLPQGVKPPLLEGSIKDIREVKDLELRVQELAWHEGWGSGLYRICILQDTGQGQIPREWRDVEIQVPREAPPPKELLKDNSNNNGNACPSGGNSDFLTQVQQYSVLQKALQEAVPKGPDPSGLADQQMQFFQKGIDLTKNQFTPQQQQNPLDVIMSLVKLGMIQIPGQGVVQNPPPDTLALLRTLKELLPAPTPPVQPLLPPDPWEGLRKLTELGILDLRKKDEDTLGSMGKAVELFQALAPLLGGGNGEKTTATTELIRTIGPQAEGIVSRVTETINNVVNFGKEKLRVQLGVAQQIPVPQHPTSANFRMQTNSQAPLSTSPLPPAQGFVTSSQQNQVPFNATTDLSPSGNYPVTTTVEAPTGTPISTETSASTNRNPIISQILDAVHNGNAGFYPQLKELMTIYINPQILEQLLSGVVSPEIFLTSLSNMTREPELARNEVKLYLDGFLKWYQNNNIIVHCVGTCKEVFEVSKEEWESDTEHTCECGGLLLAEGEA